MIEDFFSLAHFRKEALAAFTRLIVDILSLERNISFFVTYKWAQKARVFAIGKFFLSSVKQHSILLGPFISSEEKDML